ncbi:MAG: epoxyqueuosine reductase QueH [Selenomonadaceae bacterium]|nr:epoxyqueuosine reductase QueH [Selenomonadaceae bacterium]
MKLLMHMCCGPCSCYPLERLRAEGVEPTGYFFNPNIHPYEEWRRRLNAARMFAEKVGLELIVDNHYGLREFLSRVLPLVNDDDTIKNPDGHHARCRVCYAWRLGATAEYASTHGFDAFTSTLLYSRHQNHDVIRSIGETFARRFDVEFRYEDWREGWQRGIDLSIELGLYRQNYCGCIFSEEERFSSELRKRRKKFFRSLHSDEP